METEIEVDRLSGWLLDAVHDAKADEASEINNAGEEAQLAYLGMTRDEAIKAAQEEG